MRRLAIPIILVLVTAGAKDCDGENDMVCSCRYVRYLNPYATRVEHVTYDISEAECAEKDDMVATECSMQEADASVRHPFEP